MTEKVLTAEEYAKTLKRGFLKLEVSFYPDRIETTHQLEANALTERDGKRLLELLARITHTVAQGTTGALETLTGGPVVRQGGEVKMVEFMKL